MSDPQRPSGDGPMGGRGENRRLWIFGDNTVECSRAAVLIAEACALRPSDLQPLAGPAHIPTYRLVGGAPGGQSLDLQLYAGYGRWVFDPREALARRGGLLREAPDAIVVDAESGELLVCIEFCGALPAGNNAWQRHGRALAAGLARVPFIGIAEVGGVELGPGRVVGASRFPNPIAALAYLSLEQTVGTPCFLSLEPSPTAPKTTASRLAPAIGRTATLRTLKAAIVGESDDDARHLRGEAARSGQVVLAQARRARSGALRSDEFQELAALSSPQDRTDWFADRKMPWNKRITITTTASFDGLRVAIERSGAVAIGDSGMPIGLVPANRRPELTRAVRDIYGDRLSDLAHDTLRESTRDLAVVYLAGFKPDGSDSRPDRGLLPLAKMLLGSSVDIVAAIYGPASRPTIDLALTDPADAAQRNGLWQAVIGVADVALIDGPNSEPDDPVAILCAFARASAMPPLSPTADPAGPHPPGEHDVDSVLHFTFGQAASAFEGMCNPPGGDWSGLVLTDGPRSTRYRWSSLKRVSGTAQKRPDHVAVLFGRPNIALVVESKRDAADLEEAVGTALVGYVSELVRHEPNSQSAPGATSWSSPITSPWAPSFDLVSVGAFLLDGQWPTKAILRAGVDLAIGVELGNATSPSRFFVASDSRPDVVDRLCELEGELCGWVVIEEH